MAVQVCAELFLGSAAVTLRLWVADVDVGKESATVTAAATLRNALSLPASCTVRFEPC